MPVSTMDAFRFPVTGIPNFSRTEGLFPEPGTREHAVCLFKQPFASQPCLCVQIARCCSKEHPAAKSGKGQEQEQMCWEVRPQRRVWERSADRRWLFAEAEAFLLLPSSFGEEQDGL